MRRAGLNRTGPALALAELALAELALAALALAAGGGPAQAREGLDLAVIYTADVGATASGGADGRVRYLDNLEVSLDADLDKLARIDGTVLHFTLLNNRGARVNDAAGSLQGVNNIEVARAGLRLFEAWAEKSVGPASLRVGLYDLNSEFYATESASLLMAPAFGIGSEFAASGPAGPSIFPSSALSARLRAGFGHARGYAQLAVLNARAQTFGDPAGVDLSFDDGLLVAGELGTGLGGPDRLRVSLGAWTYTRSRDALNAVDVNGDPLRERPAGIYGTLEGQLAQGGKRAVTAFLRGGLARGLTQPFVNSLQTGLIVTPALLGRPDSALSFGFQHATTSGEFRLAQLAGGDPAWQREQGLELTYSDRLLPHVTVQPDVQLLRQTGEGIPANTAVQTMLRMQVAF